jgi:hypothetical protein
MASDPLTGEQPQVAAAPAPADPVADMEAFATEGQPQAPAVQMIQGPSKAGAEVLRTAGKDDELAAQYQASTQARMDEVGAKEMEEWAGSESAPGGGQVVKTWTNDNPMIDIEASQEELPNPFPTDQEPPAEQGLGGRIMRNIGEIPGQIIGGAESALKHSLFGIEAVNDMANWLNENVADLSYTRDKAQTMTGAVTHGITEFLTGFIPIMKGMKAMNIGGKIMRPLAAGMATDFAVHDAQEKNLSNLWNEMGLPENVLVDALEARPEDTEFLARAKKAAEGAVAGTALDGLVKSIRFLRAWGHDKFIKDAKLADVDRNFGQLAPEDIKRVVGDETSPLIEKGVREAPHIPRSRQLTATERAAETRMVQKIAKDEPGAIRQYRKENGKVISGDEAKKFSDDYSADIPGSRTAYSVAAHKPGSYLAKQVYKTMLSEAPKKGEAKSVLFTAGGTGAGKSSAIRSSTALKEAESSAHIVYDSNMANLGSAVKRIDEALAADHAADIVYIVRDPVEALVDGAIKRTLNKNSPDYGRAIPLDAHVSTHKGAYEVIGQIIEKYKSNPKVNVKIHLNEGKDKVREIKYDEIPKEWYKDLDAKVKEAFDEQVRKGRIPPDIERAYRGSAGAGTRQTPGAAQPNLGGDGAGAQGARALGGPPGAGGAPSGQAAKALTPADELREYIDALPREGTALAKAKVTTKKAILQRVKEGSIKAGDVFRGTSLDELRAIAGAGKLIVGKDAEGLPGISATIIREDGFPIYNEGVGYMIPKGAKVKGKAAFEDSGRAGEVLLAESIDPKKIKYVIGDRVVSFDDLKGALEDRPPPVAEVEELDFRALAGERIEPGQAAGRALTEAEEKAQIAGLKVAQAGDEMTSAGLHPDDLKTAYATVKLDEGQVYINMARIGSPDDIKAIIRQVAEAGKKGIDEARRGKITQEETKKMAESLGMSVEDLLSRTRGQAYNAEQIVAAKAFMDASASKLKEATMKAASENAGDIDHFMFRKTLATHHAIVSEVLGAGAEAGRALAAHRITAKGAIEQARQISQYLNSLGGTTTTKDMAKRLAILMEHGDPAALRKVVEKAWSAKTFDAVREIWINGLLSAPTTHIVNAASNAMVLVTSIAERAIAGRISELTGTRGGVEIGEATHMLYGLSESVGDAFKLAWLAFKTGEAGHSLNRVELPTEAAVSSAGLGLRQGSATAKAVDFLGDWVVRLPGRFLGSADEFFKTINYRMELHAQALRQATSEGHVGRALAERMRELRLNPPENLRLASADTAMLNTFTNDVGAFGSALLNLRAKAPAISFIVPFLKTPVNIARFTFERSPLAPLVGQWRADIAAGGARADLALARMSLGTMVMFHALNLADSGQISGKGPRGQGHLEAMKRQGWQEYSFQANGKWYSFSRADPYGSLMGFAADISEAIKHGEFDEDDVDEWNEVVAMGTAAVSQVAVSKTYLRGVSEFFNMVTGDKKDVENYIENFASSFVPYTSLAGAIERTQDPTVRDYQDPWEAIQNKLLGLSKNLPPKRDLWGRELSSSSDFGSTFDYTPEGQERVTKAYDFLSPIKAKNIKPEPVDTEIMRLAPYASLENIEGAPPTRIMKKTVFDGVAVNLKKHRDVFDEYVKLSGNELKDPGSGLGCMDFLNEVTSGKGPYGTMYKDVMSDATKIKFINSTVNRYRKMAQKQILSDPKFAQFADEVAQIKQMKQAALLPQGVTQ